MKKFLAQSPEDRILFFKEAATRMGAGVTDVIVEKDFWVCWVLRQIFGYEELAKQITFKGGTSLSKAYHLIDRFSEDIDLTISKDAPYLANGENPTEESISGKERQRRIKALKENARRYVVELVLPTLQNIFARELPNTEGWKLTLDPTDPDHQTILFDYPFAISDGRWGRTHWEELGDYASGKEFPYIQNTIKLEFGARGDIEPSENKKITPYVAESYPQLFDEPHSKVHVLSAERTFWEKATILHALHHGSKIRDRMSRHYYDTFMMIQKGVADKALQDVPLLEKVVRNKILLFQDSKASYETAVIGKLRLAPRSDMVEGMKQDYIAMKEMFLSDIPSFDTIIETLLKLEKRINGAV